jgi:hypothetical protein
MRTGYYDIWSGGFFSGEIKASALGFYEDSADEAAGKPVLRQTQFFRRVNSSLGA